MNQLLKQIANYALTESNKLVNDLTEEQCLEFFDGYFTEEHALMTRSFGLPALLLRKHIQLILDYHTPDNAPRIRKGRIFNKTRNAISLRAYSIKKKAKANYYPEPFDNEELSKIKSKNVIKHPILLLVTQTGSFYKRLNHARGKEASGVTYYQSHKACRIRSKAKEGYYGQGLDEIILSLTTQELIKHPIFLTNFSITRNKKDAVVKQIMNGAV